MGSTTVDRLFGCQNMRQKNSEFYFEDSRQNSSEQDFNRLNLANITHFLETT